MFVVLLHLFQWFFPCMFFFISAVWYIISLPPKLQTTSFRSLFQQKIAAQLLFHCLSYGFHLNVWASDEDFRFLFRKIVVHLFDCVSFLYFDNIWSSYLSYPHYVLLIVIGYFLCHTTWTEKMAWPSANLENRFYTSLRKGDSQLKHNSLTSTIPGLTWHSPYLLHIPARALYVGRYPPESVSVLWPAPTLSLSFLMAQAIFEPIFSLIIPQQFST